MSAFVAFLPLHGLEIFEKPNVGIWNFMEGELQKKGLAVDKQNSCYYGCSVSLGILAYNEFALIYSWRWLKNAYSTFSLIFCTQDQDAEFARKVGITFRSVAM
jgi:hypothetical protein